MTEMLNVPFDLPPFMRPYAAAMLYGLWGWLTRPLQLIVKVGVPEYAWGRAAKRRVARGRNELQSRRVGSLPARIVGLRYL